MSTEEKTLLILEPNTLDLQKLMRYNELKIKGIPEPELTRAVEAEFVDYITPEAEPWPGEITGVDNAGPINNDLIFASASPPLVLPQENFPGPYDTSNVNPYPNNPTPDPNSIGGMSNTYDFTNFPYPGDNTNWLGLAAPDNAEPPTSGIEGFNSEKAIPEWRREDVEQSQVYPENGLDIILPPSGQLNEAIAKDKKKQKKSFLQRIAPWLAIIGGSAAAGQLIDDYMNKAPEEPEERNKYFTHTLPTIHAKFTLSFSHKGKDVCDDFAGEIFDLTDKTNRPILPTEGLGYSNLTHPNCLFPDTLIEFPNGIDSAIRSWYEGPVIEIFTSLGSSLTVTPNHMFLTPQGFIAADFLRKGDQVINSSNSKRVIPTINPNNNRKPTTIKQVFDSLVKSGSSSTTRVPTSSEYLHGDARFSHGNIDVVRTNSFLCNTGKSFLFKHLLTRFFNRSYSTLSFLLGNRTLALFLDRSLSSSDRIMSGSRKTTSFFSSRMRHTQELGFSSSSGSNTISLEMFDDVSSTTLKNLSKSLNRFSSVVQLDEVVNINVKSYSGFVYDIQSPSTLYTGNDIIISNCQCTWVMQKVDTLTDSLTRKQQTNFDDIASHIRKAAKDHTLHTVQPDGKLSKRTRGSNPMQEAIGKIREQFNWLGDEYITNAKELASQNNGVLYLIRAAQATITDHRSEGEQYRRKLSGQELQGMARTAIKHGMDINHESAYKTQATILDADYDPNRKEIQMVVMEKDPQINEYIRNGAITAVSINGGNPRRQVIEPCDDDCTSGCEMCNVPQGVILGEDDGIGMTWVVTDPRGIFYKGQHIESAEPGIKNTLIEIL